MTEQCIITITREGEDYSIDIKGKMQPFHVLEALNKIGKNMLTRAYNQYVDAKEKSSKELGGLKIVGIIISDKEPPPAPEKNKTTDPSKN